MQAARAWFDRQLPPWVSRIRGSSALARASRPYRAVRPRPWRDRQARTASRLPALYGEVLVACFDGRRTSLWWVERDRAAERGDADGVRVVGTAATEASPSARVLGALLEQLGRGPRRAIVVTNDVELAVRYGPQGPQGPHQTEDAPTADGRARGWATHGSGEDRRTIVASMRRSDGLRWATALDELGLRFEGAYPLLGSALAGLSLGSDGGARLAIQLEACGLAVLEACGESCRAVAVVDGAPTLDGCLEQIGPGCPEVWLCGDGVDLSQYGYAVVRGGRTWVHLPGLRAVGAPPGASGMRRGAAVVGAARHALGLSAVDATICVPPIGSLGRSPSTGSS